MAAIGAADVMRNALRTTSPLRWSTIRLDRAGEDSDDDGDDPVYVIPYVITGPFRLRDKAVIEVSNSKTYNIKIKIIFK